MQCFNIIFQKKYIFKNIGFYIYACLIILDLACLIYLIIRDFKTLIKEIENLKSYLLNKNKNESDKVETNNIHENRKIRIKKENHTVKKRN